MLKRLIFSKIFAAKVPILGLSLFFVFFSI
jgi:hypothetical protein